MRKVVPIECAVMADFADRAEEIFDNIPPNSDGYEFLPSYTMHLADRTEEIEEVSNPFWDCLPEIIEKKNDPEIDFGQYINDLIQDNFNEFSWDDEGLSDYYYQALFYSEMAKRLKDSANSHIDDISEKHIAEIDRLKKWIDDAFLAVSIQKQYVEDNL